MQKEIRKKYSEVIFHQKKEKENCTSSLKSFE